MVGELEALTTGDQGLRKEAYQATQLSMFLLQSKKMQERESNRQQGGSQSTLREKWGTAFLNYRAHKDNTTHLERLVLSLFLLSLRYQDSAQE